MMLRILLFSIFVFLNVVIFFEYQKRHIPVKIQSQPTVIYRSVAKRSVEPSKLILEFNEINSKIKGLTCDEMQVKIWEGKSVISASGNIRYEKPKNFRMIVQKFFNKELDLGSNENLFWFWGRRSAEPGLFYAKHEDYSKTRLKTPFNPIWIMASLGIDQINLKNVEFIDERSVMEKTINSFGKPIIISTFIGSNKRIQNILTTDIDGKLLISVTIDEYIGIFPKKIVYHWLEENKTMQLTLKNPREIGLSNAKLWEMPNIQPQTDMGID